MSENDKSKPIQSTKELPNFPYNIWHSICTEDTTTEAIEGLDSKTAIL
jgi:hypothetical protein